MRSSDAGVEVAPGDPGQISQAAGWHQELADAFELHHATITGATSTVLATWNGEAASSYGQLATIVADRFVAAAGDARTVARSLSRYAGELERCQREGMRALHESEHWLLEQNKWQTKLNDANHAIVKAKQQITNAQLILSIPVTGSVGIPADTRFIHSGATANLHAGQVALTKAQADQRTAEAQLRHAQQEAMRWQAIGRRAWEDAVHAATQVAGAVETVNVAPPPLAGWIRRDFPNLGPGSPAGPHGAIWAPSGPHKPPAKPRYRIQGTGNGGWIYIPMRHPAAKPVGGGGSGSGRTVIGGGPSRGSGSGRTVIGGGPSRGSGSGRTVIGGGPSRGSGTTTIY